MKSKDERRERYLKRKQEIDSKHAAWQKQHAEKAAARRDRSKVEAERSSLRKTPQVRLEKAAKRQLQLANLQLALVLAPIAIAAIVFVCLVGFFVFG